MRGYDQESTLIKDIEQVLAEPKQEYQTRRARTAEAIAREAEARARAAEAMARERMAISGGGGAIDESGPKKQP